MVMFSILLYFLVKINWLEFVVETVYISAVNSSDCAEVNLLQKCIGAWINFVDKPACKSLEEVLAKLKELGLALSQHDEG